jgi:hypothetical protein
VSDLRDLDLDYVRPPHKPPGPPFWPILAAGGLILVLVALAVFGWYSRRARSAPQQTTAPAATGERANRAATPPLGATGDAIELRPLNESDELVRQLVGRVSTHPAVVAWLATDGLVRNATVIVQNVSAGETPARHLRRLSPQDAFAVRSQSGDTVIDPRSFARYTWIAQAVASLDAAGSARLYGTLKPRVEEAYAELGSPDAKFDAVLERAIVTLLQTPVVEGDIRLVTRGALYAYADPRLEELSPAQKQLVRTGPDNTRLIQAKLREIALALGITADRLPQPTTIRAR